MMCGGCANQSCNLKNEPDQINASYMSYALGTAQEVDAYEKSFVLTSVEATSGRELPEGDIVINYSNSRIINGNAASLTQPSRVLVAYLIPGNEIAAYSITLVGNASIDELGLSFLFGKETERWQS